MQFSYSWLKTQADTELSADKLEHLLTMSGLEVEEAETAAPAFTGVVIAEVKSVEKHPDADRLNVEAFFEFLSASNDIRASFERIPICMSNKSLFHSNFTYLRTILIGVEHIVHTQSVRRKYKNYWNCWKC